MHVNWTLLIFQNQTANLHLFSSIQIDAALKVLPHLMVPFKDFGLSFTMTIPYLKRYPKVTALIKKRRYCFNVRSFAPQFMLTCNPLLNSSQLFINNNKSLSKKKIVAANYSPLLLIKLRLLIKKMIEKTT
jgi:hypothetical protein